MELSCHSHEMGQLINFVCLLVSISRSLIRCSAHGYHFRHAAFETEFRAGSLQGLLPGAPTDPGVRVNAPGSSRCGIAVHHTTRSFCGDTLMRHGVLGVVPTPRPQRGTPFATRGPEGPFPRLNATMGHCDFLTVFSP